MTGNGPRGPDKMGPSYTGDETSQGEIILRTKRRRQIFIGGLILMGVLAVVFSLI